MLHLVTSFSLRHIIYHVKEDFIGLVSNKICHHHLQQSHLGDTNPQVAYDVCRSRLDAVIGVIGNIVLNQKVLSLTCWGLIVPAVVLRL